MICRVTGAVFAALVFSAPAVALQLITASEAALPPEPSVGHDRGISRGPTVIVISPAPGTGMLKSPVNLKVRFESHGGTWIDTDSVLLTYLRKPAVDLTQRVRAYIVPSGIEVDDAEVPPGTHTLRVDVTDSNGHTGWADITFTVSK
jgi:hypothetical protein